MSRRALLQYLELLNQSGIRQLFITPSQMPDPDDKGALLDSLAQQYADCQKCPLSTGRIKLVYGEGNPDARLMLIGEGPGDNENQTGRPFVGAAGQLLDKMLAAIQIKRAEIYITNIVKCRPPGNRNPSNEERLACMPYLVEQINIIRPRIILVMGLVAAQSILGSTETLSNLRQRQHSFMGIPVFVSYHPAALLRNPNWKRPAWEDLQALQKVYESMI
nr:uracil-DNA glycosylase [Candidatus Cloacimonadota bacterium]